MNPAAHSVIIWQTVWYLVTVMGMTNRAAAPAPGTRRRVQAGAYVITVNAHPSGAFSVHIEDAATGAEHDHLRRSWPTWEQARAMARNAYRHFIRGGSVDLPAEVKLAPAAKGTATKVTDPGLVALEVAIFDGYLRRGGGIGRASVTLLKALAKRGHVDLVVEMQGRRKVIVGARITRAGRIAHLRATGADRLTYVLSA